MPSNLHLEVEPALKAELEKRAAALRISVQALVKVILWARLRGKKLV